MNVGRAALERQKGDRIDMNLWINGRTVTDSHCREMPDFLQMHTEGARWGKLMGCGTVAELNELVDSGGIRELIRVNEALHERCFSAIADMICARKAGVVMLAGPSASGKTTSAHRLATQLRVHGKHPILLSLDDYYIDRNKLPPLPNGSLDLEHIHAIDTPLLGHHLQALLNGSEVDLPVFNFKTGRREWCGRKLRPEPNAVIIVEGIHGLNPVLLPPHLPSPVVFRIYVSSLLLLDTDDHNRIPTDHLRLLRRIVRDLKTRGASVQRTLSMWNSVQRGEEKWILPFRENADVIFNSSTLYEPVVLKKHVSPLLSSLAPGDNGYDKAQSLAKTLSYVHEANVDNEIPPTGILREFIGGNTFYQ